MNSKVVPQRNIVFGFKQRRRFAIEAQDVKDHAVKRRPEDVRSLCEKCVERRPVVFETRAFVTHAEAHCARLRRNPELLQQLCAEAGFSEFRTHDFDEPANLYYEVRGG